MVDSCGRNGIAHRLVPAMGPLVNGLIGEYVRAGRPRGKTFRPHEQEIISTSYWGAKVRIIPCSYKLVCGTAEVLEPRAGLPSSNGICSENSAVMIRLG